MAKERKDLSNQEPYSAERRLFEDIFSYEFESGLLSNEISLQAQAARKEVVGALLSDLEARDNNSLKRGVRIIKMRYGIDGGEIIKIKDIAKQFGLSVSRIGQLQNQAIRALRYPPRSKKLGFFLPYRNDTVARANGITCHWDLAIRLIPDLDLTNPYGTRKLDELRVRESQIVQKIWPEEAKLQMSNPLEWTLGLSTDDLEPRHLQRISTVISSLP